MYILNVAVAYSVYREYQNGVLFLGWLEGDMVGQAWLQLRGKNRSRGKTTQGSTAKKPRLDTHKRGLPVAWDRETFVKCPRLAERFRAFTQPRPAEGG